MYRITPRMRQNLEQSLTRFHDLLNGGRCDGWQLEELLVRAIQSDTRAQHNVFWQEGGHDDKADMRVRTNGEVHSLQIKSGRIDGKRDPKLVLSGHRLSRFNGDFNAMTDYLNNRGAANILSVPYERIDDERGRRHIYTVSYVDVEYLQGLEPDGWEERGASFYQTNYAGVRLSLTEKMSWQVWWRIPVDLIHKTEPIVIG